jgi:hypothetical protein
MSYFKIVVMTLLVNNEQSDNFAAHNTGQIYYKTEQTVEMH